jgi:hypothetical protein
VEGWAWARSRPQRSSPAQRSAALGLHWLRAFQETGGGLAGHVGFTAEAIFGARAVGLPMDALQALAGRPARDFLRDASGRYAAGNAAQAGKALAGAVAADLDPHDTGGVDLIAVLVDRYDPSSGWYGASVWDQSWAMIGLAAAGEPIPAAARPALAAARSSAGGWGALAGAETPDSDSTGLALQAMAAAGAKAEDPEIAAALTWLAGLRQADGGFAHEDAAGPSNLNATALALQGLLALSEDLAGDRWAPGGVGPLQFLSERQENSGRFRFGPTQEDISDLVASLQAVPAVAGRSLPLGGPRAAIGRGAVWMGAHRGADGSFEGFNPGGSIDAVLALAASGIDPESLPGPDGRPGPSVRSYLTAAAADYAGRGPSAAGKLATGAIALGADPRNFGGEDLVARIQNSYDPTTGTFGSGGTWDQSWAILGLAAAEAEIPPLAVLQTQLAAAPGGGWGFEARAAEADPDSTGLALQALAAAGLDQDHPSLRLAVNRLFELQNADGGWGEGASNASSTAMAIGGLVAVGQAVDGAGWMPAAAGRPARSPREALLSLQAPGGGFAGFSGPEDPGASYAALLGLSARALPIRADADTQGPRIFLPFLIRKF